MFYNIGFPDFSYSGKQINGAHISNLFPKSLLYNSHTDQKTKQQTKQQTKLKENIEQCCSVHQSNNVNTSNSCRNTGCTSERDWVSRTPELCSSSSSSCWVRSFVVSPAFSPWASASSLFSLISPSQLYSVPSTEEENVSYQTHVWCT